MDNTQAGVLGYNDILSLKIKQSDARRIFRSYMEPGINRDLFLDELEQFFNRVMAANGIHAIITVITDEQTKDETRELFLEDAVQQWVKKYPPSSTRNIAAFTESTQESYPAYLSINREADGKIYATARERGHGGNKMAKIEMTPQEAAAFAHMFYKNTR